MIIRLMLGQEIKHNQTTTKTYSTRFFPENITAEKVFDNLSLGTPYENSSSAALPRVFFILWSYQLWL